MSLPREKVICDCCQVAESSVVCRAPSLYSEEIFTLVRCSRCWLVYVNPRQEESAKLAQLKAALGTAAFEEAQERDQKVYQSILERIERYCPRGALLDVGCATGGLLREARQRGWNVQGVEVSRPAAEFARKTYGLPVHAGTLEEASLPEKSFDVIVMVHTIEHLYHPSRTVREVCRLLKPGGYFYCMTPDFHHYATQFVQLFGWLRKTDQIDPTGHPYHFTPKTLANLIQRQGFRIRQCGSPIAGLFAERTNRSSKFKAYGIRWATLPAIVLSKAIPIGSTIQCVAERPVQ